MPLRRLVLIFLFGALRSGAAWAAPAPSLFDAPETPARDDLLFQRVFAPQWRRVLDAEKKRPTFTASGDALRGSDAEHWRNLVQRAKTSPELDVLRMASAYFNQWLPKRDQDTWNIDEHWDTPREFISRRGGDCEDYAIAKYFALRFLGVPARDLRLVIIRQEIPKGQYRPGLHAILAARANSTWFILDNNARPRDGIFPQSQYKGRFLPLYSFNEDGAWVHFPDPVRKQ